MDSLHCVDVRLAQGGDPVVDARLALAFPKSGGPELTVVVTGSDLPTVEHPRWVAVGPDDSGVMITAVEAGAIGFIVDSRPIDDIVSEIEKAASGAAVIPESMLGRLLTHVVAQRRAERLASEQLDVLSKREREVFEVAATGADKNVIGDRLMISPETARTHLSNIMAKLGLHTRAELIALAAACGFDTQPEESP